MGKTTMLDRLIQGLKRDWIFWVELALFLAAIVFYLWVGGKGE